MEENDDRQKERKKTVSEALETSTACWAEKKRRPPSFPLGKTACGSIFELWVALQLHPQQERLGGR